MNREPKCAMERQRAIARVTGGGAGAGTGRTSEGLEYAGGWTTSCASTYGKLVEALTGIDTYRWSPSGSLSLPLRFVCVSLGRTGLP